MYSLHGCGYKTNPRPATATVPGEIALVNAHAYDDRVVLKWDVPRLNADGSLFSDISGFKVYRLEQTVGEECENCEEKRKPYANIDFQKPGDAVIKDGEVVFTDRSISPGHSYMYWLSVYNLKGRESRLSQDVAVVLDQAPPTPASLQATVVPAGVRLEWQAPADRQGIKNYRIYRGSTPDIEAMQLVGTTRLGETSFLDKTVEAGKVYHYLIRSMKMNRGISFESRPSTSVQISVSPVLRQPPENVNSASTNEGIRIYWEPVKIAGDETRYNVYRSEGSRMFQKINSEAVRNPWFVDKKVVRNQIYRYAITAFPNGRPDEESARSGSSAVRFTR